MVPKCVRICASIVNQHATTKELPSHIYVATILFRYNGSLQLEQNMTMITQRVIIYISENFLHFRELSS